MKFLARVLPLFLAFAGLALAAEPAKSKAPDALGGTQLNPDEKVDILPLVLHAKHPTYPRSLKDSGLSGEVIVEYEVDAFGRVKNARAVRSPHPDMSKAAVQAISDSVYRPARKDGKPVPIQLTAKINFTAKTKKKK
jgi:TonB family protein